MASGQSGRSRGIKNKPRRSGVMFGC